MTDQNKDRIEVLLEKFRIGAAALVGVSADEEALT
jgi:hypothetical protein